MFEVVLEFKGGMSENHLLEFYDASQAMLGFQRTLALTTHLVLNDGVITQAPSLKNAEILVGPLEQGSLKIPAYITALSVGFYSLGSLESTNPLGHIMYSAYDYVISESLGFHIDYKKTLGQSYEELKEKKQNELPILDQSRFDSVIEKCEGAILGMHRPIVRSSSAERALISFGTKKSKKSLTGGLDGESYAFIAETKREDLPEKILGKVSSYNINTYKGRLYCTKENRPVPFELADNIRSRRFVNSVTSSLQMNALDRSSSDPNLVFDVYRNVSRTGRLKSYFVVGVSKQ